MISFFYPLDGEYLAFVYHLVWPKMPYNVKILSEKLWVIVLVYLIVFHSVFGI